MGRGALRLYLTFAGKKVLQFNKWITREVTEKVIIFLQSTITVSSVFRSATAKLLEWILLTLLVQWNLSKLSWIGPDLPRFIENLDYRYYIENVENFSIKSNQ